MKHLIVLVLCVVAFEFCNTQSDNIYLSNIPDVQIFQSSDCAAGFHYRIPMNGRCQQIPPWLHEDNWSLGIMVPDGMYVRFYSDENCAETMHMSINSNAIPDREGISSNCMNGDLGGFGGLTPRSLRLITYVIN